MITTFYILIFVCGVGLGVCIGDLSMRLAHISLLDRVKTKVSTTQQARELRRELKYDDEIVRRLNEKN